MSDLIENTLGLIQPLDRGAMEKALARQNTLTKPAGSLGRLEELSIRMAGIQCRGLPQVNKKAVVVMAADHGVARQGTSAYPQAVTAQMVLNFLRGGAAINVISRQIGARVIVVDMGVAGDLESTPNLVSRKISSGTKDMSLGPAMTTGQAIRSIEIGIEILTQEARKGLDIVATGEMGIGNTTASSAICSVFTGHRPAEVTGRGTGLDDKQLRHKIETIETALAVNRPDPHQPLDILAKVGGFEIGGLAGVMLGAAARRIAVIVDGFISGAAAAIAVGLCPAVKEYLIAGHNSVEPGHKILLQYLGLKPLLDLDLRLGEGTGAALGMILTETACRILSQMATFTEAGVATKEEN